MSYADGWAALNLEMPPRVPRTEYSVDQHWPLIQQVTGIDVNARSPFETLDAATRALVKTWNYDLYWAVLLGRQLLGDCVTSMGHAEYADGGVDRDNAVGSFLRDVDDALAFDPLERLPGVDHNTMRKAHDDLYRRQCEIFPDCVNMTGSYISMFSGLIEIFGWDLMLEAIGEDADAFGEIANRYSQWIQPHFEIMAECDAPVIMVHDDLTWTSGPVVSPAWYREYIFPNLKRQIAPLLEAGKKVLFTSDGNYDVFLDDIADLGVHGFVLEPCTDMKRIADRYGKTHAFIGNADTRILLSGSKAQIRAEVERCMTIGKACPGFFMAVGNHIPANTPVENAIYYNEAYEELSVR